MLSHWRPFFASRVVVDLLRCGIGGRHLPVACRDEGDGDPVPHLRGERHPDSGAQRRVLDGVEQAQREREPSDGHCFRGTHALSLPVLWCS